MRDVIIATVVYCFLFVLLTLDVSGPMASLSAETVQKLHRLASELVFWAATFYICASGTYGAFARQDRFAMSREHPVLNRLLSLLMLVSPFLTVFVDVRFMYIMLGLLLLSHVRSRTETERQIAFSQSRAFSNILLIMLFTLALMLMNNNDYYVSSLLDFNSVQSSTDGSPDAR